LRREFFWERKNRPDFSGSISGASMNPARSLGPSLVGTIFFDTGNTQFLWDYHYIYWAGPLLGATISAVFFRLVFVRTARIIP
jgi:glycerol uptake facilitator-like aquaporin